MKIPDRLDDITPLRIEIAAKIAFPDGTMGAAGLRKERDAGRLETELIAGKEYVTLAAITRMRELCRGRRKGSISFGAKKAEKKPGSSETGPDGSLGMDQRSSALEAAKKAVQDLKVKRRLSPKSPLSNRPCANKDT